MPPKRKDRLGAKGNSGWMFTKNNSCYSPVIKWRASSSLTYWDEVDAKQISLICEVGIVIPCEIQRFERFKCFECCECFKCFKCFKCFGCFKCFQCLKYFKCFHYFKHFEYFKFFKYFECFKCFQCFKCFGRLNCFECFKCFEWFKCFEGFNYRGWEKEYPPPSGLFWSIHDRFWI
jgi:hypothetical protein